MILYNQKIYIKIIG